MNPAPTAAEIAAQPTPFMDFSDALLMLKGGKRVAREGWNGSGMFVYRVPADTYPARTEVAKAEFGDMVHYCAYFALKTAQGNVATWVPSSTDLDAADWMVV